MNIAKDAFRAAFAVETIRATLAALRAGQVANATAQLTAALLILDQRKERTK
jgi:hypothetical protein